jgi:hypothetical protein
MEQRLVTSARMLSPRQTTKRPDLSIRATNTSASYVATNRSRTPANKSTVPPPYEFKPNIVKVFENNKETLQNLFRHYCTSSGGVDIYKMKSIKLLKMMRDAKLLKVKMRYLTFNFLGN